MTYCSHCGNPVPEDAASCPGCGAPVTEAVPDEQDSQSALSVDPGMTAQVRQLAREGRKIPAIKEYRLQTGASLKDAKDAVERWMNAEGIVGAKGAGCGTSVLLLVACVGSGLLIFV